MPAYQKYEQEEEGNFKNLTIQNMFADQPGKNKQQEEFDITMRNMQ